MTTDYPKREAYFSHKFVRLVMRVCGAQDIGPDGAWLLTIIAHTEDARRYTGPVTFWNEQLISLMGLNSRKQLDRIRDRCVASGWLHYERDSRRTVGRYWVLVPQDFGGMDDTDVSCDASLWAKNDTRVSQECPISVPRVSHERHISVPSSTLSFPLPNPNTHTHTQAPAAREVSPLRTWTLPDGCSVDLAAAIDSWQAWRLSVDGRPTDEIRLTLMLSQARSAGWDDEKICRSIPFSVAKGAKSWLDPDVDFQRQRGSNGKQTKQNRGFLDG